MLHELSSAQPTPADLSLAGADDVRSTYRRLVGLGWDIGQAGNLTAVSPDWP